MSYYVKFESHAVFFTLDKHLLTRGSIRYRGGIRRRMLYDKFRSFRKQKRPTKNIANPTLIGHTTRSNAGFQKPKRVFRRRFRNFSKKKFDTDEIDEASWKIVRPHWPHDSWRENTRDPFKSYRSKLQQHNRTNRKRRLVNYNLFQLDCTPTVIIWP